MTATLAGRDGYHCNVYVFMTANHLTKHSTITKLMERRKTAVTKYLQLYGHCTCVEDWEQFHDRRVSK